MSRIRTIKPSMAESEALAAIPRETLYTWVMLWPHCDDFGHHTANPRLVLAAIYPLRDDVDAESVEAELELLEEAGRICRYTGCDGKPYLHVTGWDEHQRVDNASKVWLPLCSRHEAHRECRQHGADCSGSVEFAASRRESPRVAARAKKEDGRRKTEDGARKTEDGSIVPNGTHPSSEAAEGVSNVTVLRPPPPDERVYVAWCRAGSLNGRTSFTKERRAKVRGRLAEYPLEDVMDAAEGIWLDTWHVGHQRTDLIYAMRDVERFRDLKRGLIRDQPEMAKPTQGEMKIAKINALALFSQEQRRQELGGFLE